MSQVVRIPRVGDRFMHPLSIKYGYPIGTWCTGNVTRFDLVFANQTAFNQPLQQWRTSSATSMIGMFDGAQAFDQSLVSIAMTGSRTLRRFPYTLFSSEIFIVYAGAL
jgi:Mycoplasma protein of unknown function, DUF285